MSRRQNKQAIIFMLLIATVAWLALFLQLYILISNTASNGPLQAAGRFFSYFTILTNLLVAVCITAILLSPHSIAGKFFSKSTVIAAITLYIFIVGLVYNIILRYIWEPKGLQRWADEALHVATPVLFVFYWLLFIPKGSLKWSDSFRWLIYPAAYLVYALLIGSFSGFYTYPFINVTELGYPRVLLNALALTIVFLLTGLLLVTIDRTLARRMR